LLTLISTLSFGLFANADTDSTKTAIIVMAAKGACCFAILRMWNPPWVSASKVRGGHIPVNTIFVKSGAVPAGVFGVKRIRAAKCPIGRPSTSSAVIRYTAVIETRNMTKWLK
jgi:hypothetical protein